MSKYKSAKVASTPLELLTRYSSLASVQMLSTSLEEREVGRSNIRICKILLSEHPELLKDIKPLSFLSHIVNWIESSS